MKTQTTSLGIKPFKNRNGVTSSKLIVLNGQLSQIETTRRRQVDEVILQKIADANRREMEQLAAAELAAEQQLHRQPSRDGIMRSINPRKTAR